MVGLQANRRARLHTDLGLDEVMFRKMTGAEELSSPFQFDVNFLSDDVNLNLDDLLSESVTVEVEDSAANNSRYFNGIVASVSQVDSVGNEASYNIVLRPWTWLLTKTTNCRVFQKQTVIEIIRAVCKGHGFTDLKDNTTRSYQKREYCVQYSESDYDFISRLLESEGIYYYFEHEMGKHTLVLADALGSHEPISGNDTIPWCPADGVARNYDHVVSWNVSREVKPGKVVLADFDYEKPRTKLESTSQKARNYSKSKFEHFEFPGGFKEQNDGDNYAKSRLEEFQTEFESSSGNSHSVRLSTGRLFTLDEYPRNDQNAEYLITGARYSVSPDEDSGEPFQLSFSVIRSTQTYRPRRVTPTPRIFGLQTATVVGKSGEEIWTDEQGRIKIQFPWDRYGKSDENSSCWVRVAQTWAGKGWGTLQIPRIGQEVIVEFLDGDPDRPIVTGSVYNGEHSPPVKLPANATQSGLVTRSTKEGTAKTFNSLCFEDKVGEEQVYFHAEKDFVRVVENNDSLKVGFDDKDKGDQTIEIFNDQTITLEEGNRKITVKKGNDDQTVSEGNRSVTVDKGNDSHTVSQGDQTVDVTSGKQTVSVGSNYGLTIGAAGTIKATNSLELKVGSSSIKIEPTKITLKAMEIALAADMKIDSSAVMISESADAQLQIKGGIVQIN